MPAVRSSLSCEKPRLVAVDGLRGVAIALVLLFHFVGSCLVNAQTTGWKSVVAGIAFSGWCGVDVFFVLSGFLISGILLDQWRTPGSFRDFYWKRVLRIFPLYYAVLIVTFFIVPLFATVGGDAADESGAKYWLFLHMQNFYLLWHKACLPGVLNHLWSLAVEVQFYLFWPAIVYAFRKKALALFCLGMFVGILALRMGLRHYEVSPAYIYSLTLTRLDAFAAGALAAVVLRSGIPRVRIARWTGLIFAVSFVCLIIMACVRGGHLSCIDPVVQSYGFSLLAVSSSSLLLLVLAAGARNPLVWLLSLRPLTFLAKYSYGIYVLHLPIFPLIAVCSQPKRFPPVLRALAERNPVITFAVVSWGLSIAMAYCSYHLFEKRFLRLAGRRRAPVAANDTLHTECATGSPTGAPVAKAA